MPRKHNFYPGPSTLPLEVLEEMGDNLQDYRGIGLSLLEASHRSAEYAEVHHMAIASIISLLELPEDYTVLLIGGGASLQFSMVPLNLMHGSKVADFVCSGEWAKKAIVDAQRYGKARVIWDVATRGTLPNPSAIEVGTDSSYLHITSNETINGLQWKAFPKCSPPLVADMSSDILSRPIPIRQFGLIYAGAQKNIGVAGVTLVIIQKDLLARCPENLGAYLNYQTHAKANSLYNTPPVFAIWAMSRVLSWIEKHGGLVGMEAINQRKASLLYSVIDSSANFYRCPVAPRFRSLMNIVFSLQDQTLENTFATGATERGLIGITGHRSIGGFRASTYNAMPEEGVRALATYMKEFATKHG